MMNGMWVNGGPADSERKIFGLNDFHEFHFTCLKQQADGHLRQSLKFRMNNTNTTTINYYMCFYAYILIITCGCNGRTERFQPVWTASWNWRSSNFQTMYIQRNQTTGRTLELYPKRKREREIHSQRERERVYSHLTSSRFVILYYFFSSVLLFAQNRKTVFAWVVVLRAQNRLNRLIRSGSGAKQPNMWTYL